MRRTDGKTLKLLSLAAIFIVLAFFAGHMSAVRAAGQGFEHFLPALKEHIVSLPLDVLHFDPYIAYLTSCLMILALVMIFCKTEPPKAEMKGEEHGSNKFQTDDELLEYLNANTTEIFSPDLHEFRKE